MSYYNYEERRHAAAAQDAIHRFLNELRREAGEHKYRIPDSEEVQRAIKDMAAAVGSPV